MIQVKISKQSNYPISAVKIKKVLSDFFVSHGIVSDSICYVSFVNETKMKQIGKKYYRKQSLANSAGKDSKIHNVFSFVESEVSNFKYPNDMIFLGEIVVCFPIVVKEAKQERKLIEEKVIELVTHSALHLMGIHHKE
jgi:rRNA maturation RNase YbeY